MHTVIPAINCHVGDDECVREQFATCTTLDASWVHLDVCDGVFTYNKTWSNARAWKELTRTVGIQLEVHLMVAHPEEVIESWLQAGAKRVVVHAETLLASANTARMVDGESVINFISELCDAYEVQCVLSSNPETPLSFFSSIAARFSAFQVLAVIPGHAGQLFLPFVIEKIAMLSNMYPKAFLEVDGGITDVTASLVLAAGATALVSASFVLGASDPARAYQLLVQAKPHVSAVNKRGRGASSAARVSSVSLKK